MSPNLGIAVVTAASFAASVSGAAALAAIVAPATAALASGVLRA